MLGWNIFQKVVIKVLLVFIIICQAHLPLYVPMLFYSLTCHLPLDISFLLLSSLHYNYNLPSKHKYIFFTCSQHSSPHFPLLIRTSFLTRLSPLATNVLLLFTWPLCLSPPPRPPPASPHLTLVHTRTPDKAPKHQNYETWFWCW